MIDKLKLKIELLLIPTFFHVSKKKRDKTFPLLPYSFLNLRKNNLIKYGVMRFLWILVFTQPWLFDRK